MSESFHPLGNEAESEQLRARGGHKVKWQGMSVLIWIKFCAHGGRSHNEVHFFIAFLASRIFPSIYDGLTFLDLWKPVFLQWFCCPCWQAKKDSKPRSDGDMLRLGKRWGEARHLLLHQF